MNSSTAMPYEGTIKQTGLKNFTIDLSWQVNLISLLETIEIRAIEKILLDKKREKEIALHHYFHHFNRLYFVANHLTIIFWSYKTDKNFEMSRVHVDNYDILKYEQTCLAVLSRSRPLLRFNLSFMICQIYKCLISTSFIKVTFHQQIYII